VSAVALSPDGSTIATGTSNGTLRSWNAPNGKLINILGDGLGGIIAMAFSPAGNLLAVGCDDATVQFWDTGKSWGTQIIPA